MCLWQALFIWIVLPCSFASFSWLFKWSRCSCQMFWGASAGWAISNNTGAKSTSHKQYLLIASPILGSSFQPPQSCSQKTKMRKHAKDHVIFPVAGLNPRQEGKQQPWAQTRRNKGDALDWLWWACVKLWAKMRLVALASKRLRFLGFAAWYRAKPIL